MLYQKQSVENEESVRVIRFGSKSLNSWQKSYGPTKLELLGVVTTITDLSSYLRGNKFVVECDHQTLRPLFRNKLIGAVYDRWLTLLQQFNFEVRYKPGSKMQVADALSRCTINTLCDEGESPQENDPYFPYENEEIGNIHFVNSSAMLKCANTEMDCYFGDIEDEGGNDSISVPKSKSLKFCASASSLRKPGRSGNDSISMSKIQDSDTQSTSTTDNIPRGRISRDTYCTSKVDDFVGGNDSVSTQYMKTSSFVNSSGGGKDSISTHTIISDTLIEQNHISDNICTNNIDKENINDTNITCDYNQMQVQNNTYTPGADTVYVVFSISHKLTDLTPEKIKDLQRKDERLLHIINYLDNEDLPKFQKDVRKLLLLAPDYCMIDGLLFHDRNAKSNRTQKMNNQQLVVPYVLISKFIETFHELYLAGHMGISQTIDNISEYFYFHNLPSTVAEYVRTCHECQQRKMTSAHTKSGIISYKTPSEPFQVWQVDLFGHLPITQNGNTYVFTAIDMFSKYLFTVLLPNCDSVTVSQALFQLVCSFGCYDCLISDRGSEFISQCTAELCRLLEIKQNFTPSFIHHCLGLCERTHRTIAERLTPYFQKGRHWDEILPAITFSINGFHSASTKYSPYEVLYGFRPKFPLSVSNITAELGSLHSDFHSYITKQSEMLQPVR